MKFACFSDTTAPPMRRPLRPASSMSRPAESPGRVAEHAAGRRQPERLVRLSPAADVVEALLDDLGIGGGQAERGVDDDVAGGGAGSVRGACLNRLSR